MYTIYAFGLNCKILVSFLYRLNQADAVVYVHGKLNKYNTSLPVRTMENFDFLSLLGSIDNYKHHQRPAASILAFSLLG